MTDTLTAVQEKPILFRPEMVRAILEDRKTQTRRLVKGEALKMLAPDMFSPRFVSDPENHYCPYGVPGGHLWVREPWQVWTEFNAVAAPGISEEARRHVNYIANGNKWDARVRQARFMPRWASRLTLEIESVWIERVQQISNADAIAEGFESRAAFELAWQSMHGLESWESNPFVWAIQFKKL